MNKQTIVMQLDAKKKHTIRYHNNRDDAAINTVYVKKKSLPEPFPDEVLVTLEFEQ